jgi:hypothetical protein
MITRHSKPFFKALMAGLLACGASATAAQETTWQAIFSIPVNNGLNVPNKAFIDDVTASVRKSFPPTTS